MILGAIEGGGTKFICALAEYSARNGRLPDRPKLLDMLRIPTANPDETLQGCIDFFRGALLQPQALGIGMFGPVECNRDSPQWGWTGSTPKAGWQKVDVAGTLGRALGLPIALATDVGAAAIAEWRWGAGRGSRSCAYVTVGTGIGVGLLYDGRLLEGLSHPEAGHMRVPRLEEDRYGGCCALHGACLEGLASGPALKERWGLDPASLPAAHPAWDLEARYLGMAFANLVLVAVPERIILGGGVGLREGLAERAEIEMRQVLGGYIEQIEARCAGGAHVVVRAECGADAGIFGAVELAARTAEAQRPS